MGSHRKHGPIRQINRSFSSNLFQHSLSQIQALIRALDLHFLNPERGIGRHDFASRGKEDMPRVMAEQPLQTMPGGTDSRWRSSDHRKAGESPYHLVLSVDHAPIGTLVIRSVVGFSQTTGITSEP